MHMLIEHSSFDHFASVPWPRLDPNQMDWIQGVETLEHWLLSHIGPKISRWAWADSGYPHQIGVRFKWDQDRLLFVIVWA
jgi:hypothetical protein